MKKNTFKKLSFSFFVLSALIANGQNIKKKNVAQQFGKKIELPQQELTPSGHIKCYTNENEAFLKAQYPNRATTAEFENWLAPKIAKIKADRLAGKNIQQVYNIPVVIHIVHNGDAIGTGENITDAQAISQINVMNEDYRRLAGTNGGANSTGLAVDCEINFCLAQTDPSGNATTGVVRHVITPPNTMTPVGDWETRNDVEAMKTTTQWDPNNYLNFWIIRPGGLSLQMGGLSGLLGYAQFPDSSGLGGLNPTGGAANTDGLVCAFDAMGTIAENDGTFILNGSYNLGRTMTHEAGHWLGLRHIWGDGDCSFDDYCADTPLAADANYDCAFVDSCPNPGADMYQNYMDYSYDYCMDTFTQDQKDRMIAVMTNSPRRGSLNSSTACQTPTPIIRFTNPTGSINEGTNCNFTEMNFAVTLGKAATANATVTFNVTGGSATQNVDYTIVNPSVTFPAGSTTTQNLTIRAFNDGIVESDETIEITLTLNANGGDAILNDAAKTMTITLVNNDETPSSTQNIVVFSETFDPNSTLLTNVKDLDGDTNNWGVSSTFASATAIGFDSNFAYSQSWDGANGLNPDNILYTPTLINLPTGVLNLSFGIGTTQGGSFYQEHYSVYLTTTNPSFFTTSTLNSQTAIINNAVLAGPTQRNTINVDISSYAGQNVYLVFRHHNTFDQNLIMLDDVLITKEISTDVQTEVNTGTAYQALVNEMGTSHATDASTGKIMSSITNNTAFDYGCTSVFVNRSQTSAGAAAVNYGANTANNLKVLAKTVTVNTANNNASSNVSVMFYFSEAEIAAWETATGNNRSVLKIFKDGSTTTIPTTLGAFGTNVTLSGVATDGIAGVYYFGTDTTLGADNFEIVNAISIYPNPTNGELNINMSGDFNSSTRYTIYNSIGQIVKSAKINSQVDLKINTSAISNGVYFIKIEKDGSSKTLKFIKN